MPQNSLIIFFCLFAFCFAACSRRKRSRKKTNSTSSNQTPSKTPTKNRLNGQQDSGKISNTGTIQRKKLKRKKSSMEQQKKWVFKGRISTEIMEIENLEDGTGN